VLEIKNVTKRFGDVVAVNDVSFSIQNPQMVGIIGRSGAGKSTLLRVINRLERASSGEVFFAGNNVLSLEGRSKSEWQKNCAMIFQQFNLVPRLDVLTNVILGRSFEHGFIRSMLKLYPAEERYEALATLDRFGLAEIALQRAESLSGGQQQRVAICRAMMQAPKLILADEPIASLDPLNARLAMEALKRIHVEEKITVICNLHTLDTAKHYCSRIIGMQNGDIVFDGTPKSLTDKKAREIYGAEADEAFEASVTSTALGSVPIKAAS